MSDDTVEYRHNKTGNIYDVMGDVEPSKLDTSTIKYTYLLRAKCSETGVEVKLYFEDEKWYYIVQDNPDVYDCGGEKVLYTRDDTLWVRPKGMFHELVKINGELKPRFERVER